jgi:ech hydrogenase subunit D
MTIEEQPVREIGVDALLGEVQDMLAGGYRLAAICCTKADEQYEISYSFGLDLRFTTLRIVVSGEREIPSISSMYWGAFIYENEMHDLFGIPVKGMNIDSHAVRAPAPRSA